MGERIIRLAPGERITGLIVSDTGQELLQALIAALPPLPAESAPSPVPEPAPEPEPVPVPEPVLVPELEPQGQGGGTFTSTHTHYPGAPGEPVPEPAPDPGRSPHSSWFMPAAPPLPPLLPGPPRFLTPPPVTSPDLVSTTSPPPQRGRHAIRQQARRRGQLFIAACVLAPLGTAAVVIGTHSLSSNAAGTAGPSLVPPPSHSPSPVAPRSPAPVAARTPARTSLADVPGVPMSFAACVAFMASGDGTTSKNIYGITTASGYDVTGYSVPRQKAVFAALYKRYGTVPWTNGCA